MPITSYGLDKFVGTHLSQLSDCDAPDLQHLVQSSEHWMTNFVLDSMLRFKVAEPQHQLIFRFLMRSQRAFFEYENGRLGVHGYLDPDNEKKISSYLKSVQHFESCTEYADLALRLLARLSQRKKVFEKGGKSSRERLRAIYNDVKHEDDRIKNGELDGVGTLPLWILNDGIYSIRSRILFAEMADILEGLSKCAGRLSNPES